jgi:murein DD-endopeptidase MepM/ murein hydrolase activator NlpD
MLKRCLLLLMLVSPLAWAQVEPREVFSVRQVDLPDGGILYGKNHLGNDITVTFELTVNQNMVADQPLPLTLSIPGHSEIKLVEVHRANPQLAWRYNYRWFWNHGNKDVEHDDSVVYSLPFQRGQSCRIIQGFHGKFSHTGSDEYAIDFGFAEGTPILACREGQVVYVEERFSEGGATPYFRNRVNCVRVKHNDGTIGEYDHLRQDGAVVAEGQFVRRGELIGYSGNTGFSSGPHLHFCVYKGLNGHLRQSLPIYFKVQGSSEPTELVQGRTYTAP